ncbi:hypothetical protein LC607_01560 [Nostoc sp. CHAB 5824]|nr:hypothetical protein [Nostoc sp. CHAB 5824]
MIRNLNSLSLIVLGTLLASFSSLPSTLAQSNWPSGFYRASSRPEVYYLNTDERFHCHVQNPSQMEILGGFGQVRVVGTESFKSGSEFAGECGWPSGFYKLKSRPEVYGVNPKVVCWVSSPAMMEAYGGFDRVKVVDDSSNIFAQRKNVGDCVWPSR